MKNDYRKLLLASVACVLVGTSSAMSQQAATDLIANLKAEITDLEAEIAASETAGQNYEGGLLGMLSELNTQALTLTKSVTEARLAAEEGGVPVEIVVPAVQPDPEKAAELLGEITAQQAVVDAALQEAQGSSGLMGAMAYTVYETEKVTLAQLRQGWMQAHYGISFPVLPAMPSMGSEPPSDTVTEAPALDADDAVAVAWADPKYPQIDYDQSMFRSYDASGFVFNGWWAVENTKSAIDDSPQVYAVNVSDWGSDRVMKHPTLAVACYEGEARVLFNADSFIMTDFQTYRVPVTIRIDSEDATRTNWGALTSNQGAGLFDGPAQDMIRSLNGASKVFLRLEENNGGKHDLNLDMSGSDEAFKAVAQACGFSLIELTKEDYRAIQTMLNAAGFDTGTPDGVWGNGSRDAMRAYQAQNNLEPTGAPDEATLAAMGVTAE